MSLRRLAWPLFALSAWACGGDANSVAPPRGQLLLQVITDAPLPKAPDETADPHAPPPLFDRLRLEVFGPDGNLACAECAGEFAVDGKLVKEGKASFGIVPSPGASGYVARARLFRYISVKQGEPPPESTIELYVALPPIEREGITHVTLALRVDDVGTAVSSLMAPRAPLIGEANLDTWPQATRRPCAGTTRANEACVPGGAFWMGHPYGGANEAGADASVSRLVVLSPFFMDQHEVTVAEYRAAGLASARSDDPQLGPGNEPAGSEPLNPIDNPEFFCTYSSAPLAGEQSREAFPINCISWDAASAFCEARGKRLPSEAEYEYVAGALRSELFVWGSHDVSCPGDEACPACLDMVWGRGGFSPGALGSDSVCRVGKDLGGPLVGGSGLLDRLTLGSSQVVDLMGNLNEWTRDFWNRIDEPCWQGRPLLENPECRTPSERDVGAERPLHTVKGQAWDYMPFPAAERRGRENSAYSRGFRCVRSDGQR